MSKPKARLHISVGSLAPVNRRWLWLPRWVMRLIANSFGYFWLPCSVCGKHFSGLEWGWLGFPTIPTDKRGGGQGVCSEDCRERWWLTNHPEIWTEAQRLGAEPNLLFADRMGELGAGAVAVIQGLAILAASLLFLPPILTWWVAVPFGVLAFIGCVSRDA